MEFLVGAGLALSVGLSATFVGLDRDRAFYPIVMIIIASYYGLFAVMGGSLQALALESIAIATFLAAAIAGFKRSLWLVVAALAAHGLYDFVHGQLITNPGVPLWWPAFCLAYDLVAAAYLAWLLSRSRIRAAAT
jgi:hypothetical protein